MKPKIGYLSPLPPDKSGIAHYSACLLPYLTELADVTLFVSGEAELVLGDWVSRLIIKPIDELHKTWLYFDALIYHIGNSTYHQKIYELATMYSGIVVLHDYGLHHFIETRRVREPDSYLRELGYENGRSGFQEAWRVLQELKTPSFFDAPLNRRLLDSQLGVIVHSHYTQKLITDQSSFVPTSVIPLLDTNETEKEGITPFTKASIPAPDDAILLVVAGQITVNKQVELLLEVLAQMDNPEDSLIYCVFVGESNGEIDLASTVDRLGLQDRVIQTGFVPDYATFARWLVTADIVVNLRYPTIGETSSVVLQALALGRPTIVFDHGWYAEIDDDACVKVPVMDKMGLQNALKRLAENHQLREQISRAGQDLIQKKHQPKEIAQAYIDFAMQVAKNFDYDAPEVV